MSHTAFNQALASYESHCIHGLYSPAMVASPVAAEVAASAAAAAVSAAALASSAAAFA
jgi:hypothetical protein